MRDKQTFPVPVEPTLRAAPPVAAPPTRRAKTTRGISDPDATTVVVMCLYIASNAPNSVKAVANLQAICREHLKDAFKLEIVDVLEHPHRALADGILVTPSLAKISPSPVARIIGNLSNTASVLLALGLKGIPA